MNKNEKKKQIKALLDTMKVSGKTLLNLKAGPMKDKRTKRARTRKARKDRAIKQDQD